jgi:HD-GYP domain-containing protein (c-di-GMP phosphodiesterase class II)
VEKLSLGAQLVRAADSFDLLIRDAPVADSKKLKMAFARKSGKEISPQIAALVCRFIDESDTLSLLSDDEAIQERCLELNQTLAGFDLPRGVDVIGTLLEVFAQVIDTKHAYTAGHSQRVARYSLHIGLETDLPHDEISKLKWAALIHDLGKVAVPRSILDGGSGLNKEELEIVRRHPSFTIEILSCVSELDELGQLGACHHERWDGRGYPQGLRGEDIPFLSRIICIADAFDSLTSSRSYHNAMGTKSALRRLGEASGSQFDPDIFTVAESVLWSGTI